MGDVTPISGEIRISEPTGGGRASLPSVAEPATVGLAAMGLTTVLWSVVNGDLIPTRAALVVVPVALFYGGVVQLLAGMWEFRRGNAFGALTFSSYGLGFWVAYGLLDLLLLPSMPRTAAHQALAIYYVVWAVFSIYLWVASLRTTAVTAMFVLAFFASLAILASALYAGDNFLLFKIGGYVGIFAGGVAWYGSFAALGNSMSGRMILPVLPLSAG